jgi:hypothetical protein
MSEEWGEDTVAIDTGDAHTAKTIVSPTTKRARIRRRAWPAFALLALLALGAALLLAPDGSNTPAGTAREARVLPHHPVARRPQPPPRRRQKVRRPAHRSRVTKPHRAVRRAVPPPPVMPTPPPSEEPLAVAEEPAYEAPTATPPSSAPTSPATEFGM